MFLVILASNAQYSEAFKKMSDAQILQNQSNIDLQKLDLTSLNRFNQITGKGEATSPQSDLKDQKLEFAQRLKTLTEQLENSNRNNKALLEENAKYKRHLEDIETAMQQLRIPGPGEGLLLDSPERAEKNSLTVVPSSGSLEEEIARLITFVKRQRKNQDEILKLVKGFIDRPAPYFMASPPHREGALMICSSSVAAVMQLRDYGFNLEQRLEESDRKKISEIFEEEAIQRVRIINEEINGKMRLDTDMFFEEAMTQRTRIINEETQDGVLLYNTMLKEFQKKMENLAKRMAQVIKDKENLREDNKKICEVVVETKMALAQKDEQLRNHQEISSSSKGGFFARLFK